MRQVPFKYHTRHGPAFAFAVCDNRPNWAWVVFHSGTVSIMHHDSLLPFDASAPGADVITLLADEIGEYMSPHMDGRSLKYAPKRQSTIGAFLFHRHIFNGEVHE